MQDLFGNELITIPATPKELGIFKKDGKQYVSSLDIAKWFEREHKNVLKAFDNMDVRPNLDWLIL